MTAETLSLIAGVVLSLLFSYVPGLNTWFAGLSTDNKRLLMLGALLLSSICIWALACVGWAAQWGVNLTCDQAGIQELITAFVLALIANQGVYQISPLPEKVKSVKAAAK